MPSSSDLQFHSAGWWFKGRVTVDVTHVIICSKRNMHVCDLHDIIVSWSFNSCCSSLNILISGYYNITGNVSQWEMAIRRTVSSFRLLISTHTPHFNVVFPVPWLGLLDWGRVRPSVIRLIHHQESCRCHVVSLSHSHTFALQCVFILLISVKCFDSRMEGPRVHGGSTVRDGQVSAASQWFDDITIPLIYDGPWM